MRSVYRSCLVNTNILLYPDDPHDRARGTRALEVVRAVSAARIGYVSPQILGELFVGLRRLQPSLPDSQVMQRMRYYVQHWRICAVSSDTVMEAIRGVYEHQLHYYDAVIWATAKQNGIPLVLTEDCPGSPDVEGVRFLNPLNDDFNLSSLG